MTRYKKECVLSKVAQSHFEVMLAEVLYADIQVTFHKIPKILEKIQKSTF